MSGITELEILHKDGTGRAIAFSYDPDSLSTEAIKTILNNQIHSSEPLEIHCYVRGPYEIGGVFKTIEADEFNKANASTDEEKEKMINESLNLIKGPDTFNVIFSEPLKRK